MSLFIEAKLRARARAAATSTKTAYALLNERVEKQAAASGHTIFLSHAFDDRELLAGAVLQMEDMGYSVYLDWREDPKLDRSRVTAETAVVLRKRMEASKCLFYAITPSAKESAWMKWELGFKDGQNGRTAILPIVGSQTEIFTEQQFLGLYPYVSDGTAIGTDKNLLWIHRSAGQYVRFDSWLEGKDPSES